MEIAIRHEQGSAPITVFQVKGEIDTNTYRDLEGQVQEAFAQGTRNMLLDLTEVTYISSAGLRAIHFIFKLLTGDSPGESGEAMSRDSATVRSSRPTLNCSTRPGRCRRYCARPDLTCSSRSIAISARRWRRSEWSLNPISVSRRILRV